MDKKTKIAIAATALILIAVLIVVCVKHGSSAIVSKGEENQININSTEKLIYHEKDEEIKYAKTEIAKVDEEKKFNAEFKLSKGMEIKDNYYLCTDKKTVRDEVFIISAGGKSEIYLALTKNKNVLKNYEWQTPPDYKLSKINGVTMTIFSDDSIGIASFKIGDYTFFVDATDTTGDQLIALLQSLSKGQYE